MSAGHRGDYKVKRGYTGRMADNSLRGNAFLEITVKGAGVT